MNLKKYSVRLEPWWSLLGAPVGQEVAFRFLPYQIFLQHGHFLEITLISTAFYALIHWYFGKRFVVYTFFLGLLFWFLMVYFGILYAILAHALHNYIYWYTGFLKKIKKRKT